jgi:hypothetical protein
MVLGTIVTSLSNCMNPGIESDVDFIDVRSGTDEVVRVDSERRGAHTIDRERARKYRVQVGQYFGTRGRRGSQCTTRSTTSEVLDNAEDLVPILVDRANSINIVDGGTEDLGCRMGEALITFRWATAVLLAHKWEERARCRGALYVFSLTLQSLTSYCECTSICTPRLGTNSAFYYFTMTTLTFQSTLFAPAKLTISFFPCPSSSSSHQTECLCMTDNAIHPLRSCYM